MGAVTLQSCKRLKEGAVLLGAVHDAARPADARILGYAARAGSRCVVLPQGAPS